MSLSTKKKAKYNQSLNNYARYSGMAFEMLFIIAIGAFGGVKLDERLQTSPLFAIICSMAGIAIAFYIVIRDTLRQNQSDHGEKDTD